MNKKNALEDDLNKNEKSVQLKYKKKDLDEEKNKLLTQMRELEEYDKLLNNQLKIYRERFMLVSNFLDDCVDDVQIMDEIMCSIDKSPMKFQLFSCIDLDALSFKRKNYKMDLEGYSNYLVEVSSYEKELYDNIKALENEQKEKFNNEFFISNDEKNRLDFHGELNDSLES
jgi:hypothetical protein